MQKIIRLTVLVVMSGLCACTATRYGQTFNSTVVKTGMPNPAEIAALTHYHVNSGPEETYGALLPLLQAEGCLIESADKASGVVAARHMLPGEGAFSFTIDQIRYLSFLVLPDGSGSEIRLTIYISYQKYVTGDPNLYYIEHMGMATNPEYYRAWFLKIDDVLKR